MYFRIGQYNDAKNLIEAFHYSKLCPPLATIKVIGTFYKDNKLFEPAIAACVFSIPAAKWKEKVLELSRLVRNDTKIVLSKLISFTVKICKQKNVDLLVSYADATHDHHGGIYQASSWEYHGFRKPSMDGCVIDNKFVAGRTCNHRYGTRSPKKLSQILGIKVLPHYDAGKYLYWKALNGRGKQKAKRLNLSSLPYPKPNRQE